jgi:hypothetical protein
MPEGARIIALFSALLLICSVGIWTALLRGPLLQRLDGGRASNGVPAEFAMQALVLAFGLSAVAAVLAIIGLVTP